MNPALAVKSLFVSYHGDEAVRSFSIEQGKLVGIIGPNGAGKISCKHNSNGNIIFDTTILANKTDPHCGQNT